MINARKFRFAALPTPFSKNKTVNEVQIAFKPINEVKP